MLRPTCSSAPLTELERLLSELEASALNVLPAPWRAVLEGASGEQRPNAAAVRRLAGLASGRVAAVRQLAHWQATLGALARVIQLAADARQEGLEEAARSQLLQQQVEEVGDLAMAWWQLPSPAPPNHAWLKSVCHREPTNRRLTATDRLPRLLLLCSCSAWQQRTSRCSSSWPSRRQRSRRRAGWRKRAPRRPRKQLLFWRQSCRACRWRQPLLSRSVCNWRRSSLRHVHWQTWAGRRFRRFGSS